VKTIKDNKQDGNIARQIREAGQRMTGSEGVRKKADAGKDAFR
jgi:hypothetical protein